MTYPIVDTTPHSVGAGARYPYTSALQNSFTLKDRFGEIYELFQYDVINNFIIVPRNCTPELGAGNYERVHYKEYDWLSGFVARNSEQTRIIDETMAYMSSRSHMAGMIIEAPTAFGKTWVGSEIIRRLKHRAVVITTKEDIFMEWKETLPECLSIAPEDVGEWRGDTVPKPHHQVVVALVQSVCKGPTRYEQSIYDSFGTVLCDEVHRMGADEFSKAMWHFRGPFRIGLSATADRKDGREKVFKAHIGEIRAVSDAVPMDFKVICVNTGWKNPIVWNWEKKKNLPLEVPYGQASRVVKHLKNDTQRNMIIVNFLKAALRKDRNIVVMSDTVEHLQILEKLCVSNGILEDHFGYYCGITAAPYKKFKGRQAKLDAREAAAAKPVTLATYKMCGEGTNMPWWDTAVLATPKADVRQVIGRILRTYDGKKFPTALDLNDNDNVVLATFGGSRRKWYNQMGAEIVMK